jgi:hypothetical protein
MFGDAEWRRHARAASVATPVIAHLPDVGRERRLGAHWRISLGEERPVLARPNNLVLQHCPIGAELVLQLL